MSILFYNSKIRVFFILVLISFFFFTCKKDDEVVPYAPVNFYKNLSDPQLFPLLVVGGHVEFTGGVKGIILYRKTNSDIQAFDRLCTYKTEDRCQVAFEADDMSVKCSCCESVFLLPADGDRTTGPASAPLKQYQVDFNESSGSIHVYN